MKQGQNVHKTAIDKEMDVDRQQYKAEQHKTGRNKQTQTHNWRQCKYERQNGSRKEGSMMIIRKSLPFRKRHNKQKMLS